MSKTEMIACASVNYRLAQEAAFPAAVEDCKAAVRYLRANADKYGYNADQITVFGESAGGYTDIIGLDKDLKSIGLPRIVYTVFGAAL